MKYTLCLLLFFCFTCSAESLRLAVPEFEPYTYSRDGIPTGVGVHEVDTLMTALSQPYQITMTPNYGRAIWLTRKKLTDGFFLASQNSERDKIANFFGPVLFNSWIWLLPNTIQNDTDTKNFKQYRRVGTLLSTNTQQWLINNDYQNINTFKDTNSLLEALQDKEVDGIFLAEKVLEHGATAINFDLNQWQKKNQVKKPFGIYIAHHWLQKNPQFSDKLKHLIAEKSHH